METNFDYWLQPILSNIDNDFMDISSKNKILETAKILPQEWLYNTFGFESTLYNNSKNADFLVSTNTATNGFNLLTETANKNLSNSVVWKDVKQLASTWKTVKNMDDFWLEFDIDGEAPKTPSFFMNPLHNKGNESYQKTIKSTIKFLTGYSKNKELLSQTISVSNKLPNHAEVFQVGAMRSRPIYGIRLCFKEISLDAILKFLNDIKYAFDITPIKELLIFLQKITFDVTFNVDLLPDLSPKLGFECYMNQNLNDISKQLQWNNFIDKLEEKELIINSKAVLLKNINRTYDSSDLYDVLPPGILNTQQLIGEKAISKFKQYLHHVKISYSPNKPLTAKSYIGIQHFWDYLN